jgi:hypothetical protein
VNANDSLSSEVEAVVFESLGGHYTGDEAWSPTAPDQQVQGNGPKGESILGNAWVLNYWGLNTRQEQAWEFRPGSGLVSKVNKLLGSVPLFAIVGVIWPDMVQSQATASCRWGKGLAKRALYD